MTPGASEVNQLNRLKLLIASAQEAHAAAAAHGAAAQNSFHGRAVTRKRVADAQIEEHESRSERHPSAGFSEGGNAHPEKGILQHLEEIAQSIHSDADR